MQGGKRRMILLIIFCFVVDICDLVHNVEAIHSLCKLLPASLIFQKRFLDAGQLMKVKYSLHVHENLSFHCRSRIYKESWPSQSKVTVRKYVIYMCCTFKWLKYILSSLILYQYYRKWWACRMYFRAWLNGPSSSEISIWLSTNFDLQTLRLHRLCIWASLIRVFIVCYSFCTILTKLPKVWPFCLNFR